MSVVLGNSPGERVLLYGADGATLRQVIVDASGRLIVVGAVTQVISQTYQAAPGAHALTLRWTYTVPASRRAYVDAIMLRIDPTTVANDAAIIFTVTRSGGSEIRLVASFSIISNIKSETIPLSLAMAAGDALKAYTAQVTAGGIEFNANAFIREVTL